jgi:D-alanyl-D-alanine carboxypeptidase/D-alanyl-D-alanine-endopeptidase (penicillin-binding protein 4)
MSSSSSRRVAIGLAAVALTGCGGGGRSRPTSGQASVATATTQKRVAPPPRGGRAQLVSELRRALRLAGLHSGALVYDLTTRKTVFSVRAGVGRPPASVEKLYTSAGLLSEFGPDARLTTRVLGTGSLGSGGVWHGNLYLRGGGDPTLGSVAFNRQWLGGEGATVSSLAAQIGSRGIRRVSGSVIGDPSIFDSLRGDPSTNFAPDLADLGGELSALTYNHGESGGTVRGAVSPGAYAAEQFALALHASRVEATPAPATGLTPRRARLLASASSPTIATLLRLMNVPSDDFFAETLTKALGVLFGTGGTTAAGTRVITRAVGRLGIHPRVLDGSGLARGDRSSPIQVVRLLRAIWSMPSQRRVLYASLPVVGVNGTTRRIARHTPAQGRCSAKTGTLNNVTNLAGYCSAAGGQKLAFAIFIDGPPNQNALAVEGRMVADMVGLNASRP